MTLRTSVHDLQRLALGLLALLLVAAGAHAFPSLSGPTGGLTIPNPWTLPPDRSEIAVSVEGFDAVSPNNLAVQTSYDFSTRLNAGVYDNFEIGVEKTYRLRNTGRSESVYLSGKVRFPVDTFNFAFGVMAPTSGPDFSTAYLVGGWRALWGGVGFNFGGKSFRELNTSRFINVGVAKFGGYRLRRERIAGRTGDVFSGDADNFYGVFGFQYDLGRDFRVLGDFDGDRVSAGFRFSLKDLTLDAAYVTQKEADSLFARDTLNFLFSIGYGW